MIFKQQGTSLFFKIQQFPDIGDNSYKYILKFHLVYIFHFVYIYSVF